MTGRQQAEVRRTSIVVRLLLAFLLVSILPISTLAILSFHEGRAESGVVEEPDGHGPEGETGGETLAGIPIATIELGVAFVSLALSAFMALYVGRTIVRPIRKLEASMARVEAGDLKVTVGLMSNDELGRLGEAFDRMVTGLRREALIRDLFGQYVTPEVAQLAIEREGHLEPQVVECSVLFADVRGFTALAEVLPAHRLMQTLNSYLSRMLREVGAEGGIVNKFGGDSLLAIFGSPLNPAPDHAARAVRAAVRMRQALEEFNRAQAGDGVPQMWVGFGVATGEVVAGNLGSEAKIEYTVIGDVVNLAARLQELTRELGEPILVSASTAGDAAGAAQLESLGTHVVRGRTEPVEVFVARGPDPARLA